jgi:hypothetical protein
MPISGGGYLDYLRKTVGIGERDMRDVVLPIFFRAETSGITEAKMERRIANGLGISGKKLRWPSKLQNIIIPNM